MNANIFKTFFAWALIAITGVMSSCDYLSIDKYIENDLKIDSIFTKRRTLEAFMWGTANYLPFDNGSIIHNAYTPGPLATDEAFTTWPTDMYAGMSYVLGEINANNLGNFGRWGQWYVAIRQCNMVLQRMNECQDCIKADNDRIIGYTKFLRAYAYYLLLMNHGPVILLYDEVVANNEALEFYDRPRDLYDTCVNYICTQFEEAAETLPYRQENQIMDFGRPTKGAAYGLVARLRLQHASDLYNGGASAKSYFGNWTRKTDGAHYIQQTYDPKRWAVAAAAAKRVIDLTDSRGKLYKLHTIRLSPSFILYKDATNPVPVLDKDGNPVYNEDGNPVMQTQGGLPTNTTDPNYLREWNDDGTGGAAGICPYQSYLYMFSGDSEMTGVPEFIWGQRSPAMRNLTRYSFPQTNNGYNGMCVTQKIIDAYEMLDGNSITSASAEYPYTPSGFTDKRAEPFLDYRLNLGVSNMYHNREPRFYASIGFCEAFWPNRSTTNVANKDLTVQYYVDSSDGMAGANPQDHPITGYVLKKWVSNNDAWNAGEGAIQLSKAFPMIRYAEILLAYAEALNQLTGSFTIAVNGKDEIFTRNTGEIKKAFNLVRYRAGLPGLNDADVENASLVMQKIKHERMVEFLYENQRYFDVRRWGDYEASENEPVMGMNTSGVRAAYYQKMIVPSSRVTQRVVDRKMIFLPIPQYEMRRLPSFDQNPGW